MSTLTLPEGVQITADVSPEMAEILTPDALALVAKLHRAFEPRRRELLEARVERAKRLDAGELPDFLPETKAIRDDPTWKVAPAPADLQDRRAEITGPVDRKMIINALNSGAKVFMSDFEDSNTPTWDNTIQGQINLRDAVRRHDLASRAPTASTTRSTTRPRTLLVRPRGWHLLEKHVLRRRRAGLGGIFDFALYLFHNAKELLARGTGPYFYLPKIESHLEARLWNDVIRHGAGRARRAAGHDQGDGADRDDPRRVRDGRDPLRAARALRRAQLRALGLHLQLHQEVPQQTRTSCLPDRALVTMTTHFMRTLLAARDQDLPPARRPRDRRHGGPDPDQERPGRQRGRPSPRCAPTRSARPATATTAPGSPTRAWCRSRIEAFDARHAGPEPDRPASARTCEVSAADLLDFVPEGPITEAGPAPQHQRRHPVPRRLARAAIGCVPIYNLMEDAATAEISRCAGLAVDPQRQGRARRRPQGDTELFRALLAEELEKIHGKYPENLHSYFDRAAVLFDDISTSDDFVEFLTLPAYSMID